MQTMQKRACLLSQLDDLPLGDLLCCHGVERRPAAPVSGLGGGPCSFSGRHKQQMSWVAALFSFFPGMLRFDCMLRPGNRNTPLKRLQGTFPFLERIGSLGLHVEIGARHRGYRRA